MHKHCYDLERFSDQPWEELGGEFVTIPSGALEIAETDHIRNVRIATWIEALCDYEVGQDWFFAPDHTYASLHQDEVDGHQRQQQWLVLFYETELFAGDISEIADAAFGLEIRRNFDPKGDIAFHSVMLTSAQPLDEEAEEDLYRRIVKAAEAHAAGDTAITSFDGPLADETDSPFH
tara:strand:+ start:9415 stop:9945 length:531 start_codon:yes stop_codon:yes gene_type:complete